MRLLSGEDARLWASFARAGLLALSPLYGLGIAAYRALYDADLLHEARLPVPIISVGNLTVGGTGKTGMVLTIARMLVRHGIRPAVLNYGYRAAATGPAVVGDGRTVLLSCVEAGDEASLLAASLSGVPVLIGKRRVESGAMAIREFAPDLLILDDGFQYWRLARDVDLVLLDAAEPWGFNALLPRGLLREMPSAMRRASAVVVTHSRRVPRKTLGSLKSAISRLAPGIPVFEANYVGSELTNFHNGFSAFPDEIRGQRVGVLSALGNPSQFEASVRLWEPEELIAYRFADHHPYTLDDVAAVLDDAAFRRLDRIVTSPKDAVKLRALRVFGPNPLIWILESDFVVEPALEFTNWLLGRLGFTV